MEFCNVYKIIKSNNNFIKAAVRNLFCVQNVQNLYKRVHHESIFQTVFLACPESLRYTYNKCLYSDYLDWFG